MNKVITVLCDIEEKANDILNSAQEYKKVLDKEAKDAIQNIDSTLKKDLDKKLTILENQYSSTILKEVDDINLECETMLTKIDASYRKNLDSIANNVFQNMIEV